EGREHDESNSAQDEVNVVIRGSGGYRIEGERVPVEAGTFLRSDPETTRCPIAGPDRMTTIAVGARRGSYEPRGPFRCTRASGGARSICGSRRRQRSKRCRAKRAS